ncbi:DUF1405 domain-containing protein [Paenibacillus pasadenensis]|uniref:DUF1405 domain-containing protein n=1 Tax=Paenibacillus pasadenensis TaxID=217090 RepID=UPI00203C6C19|nr:DUF1405 domain-containing protein [Paenibacillus pasadenensis]MCM3747492.1 DUF1405 domain-containing protein [Paenibacillus pasadenensis]
MDVKLGSQLLVYRPFLWLLFIVNAIGTVYGYYWYGGQLEATFNDGHPLWRLVFVPDSPTGSLFFTLSLIYLLFPPRNPGKAATWLRVIIEGLGVVTSIKYGIWAVSIILAGASQGEPLEPAHFMLMTSHIGMAIEALLYLPFMRFGRIAAAAAFGWLLLNDYCDYKYGIFPYLPGPLLDEVPAVKAFTIGLSIFSFLVVWLCLIVFRRRRPDKAH